MKYIGLFESPMPRKTELMILYAVMSGMPMKQIVRYATVPSTASAGVDMTATICRTSTSNTTVSTTESIMNSVAVLPMACAARFLSRAPTA